MRVLIFIDDEETPTIDVTPESLLRDAAFFTTMRPMTNSVMNSQQRYLAWLMEAYQKIGLGMYGFDANGNMCVQLWSISVLTDS